MYDANVFENFFEFFQKYLFYTKNEDYFMDNNNLFSIGEIAKAIGITRKIMLNCNRNASL